MSDAPRNLFLGMVTADQRDVFYVQLEPISMPVGYELFAPELQPRYVHFLTSGLASIVTNMEDGNIAEVGLVGREGMPEALHLLGAGLVQTRCFMQIAGAGMRMRFADFQRQFGLDESTRRAVLSFVQYQSIVLSQVAACNRLHEVEPRLARWLLFVQDLIGDPELRLTQEFLSQMLGSRRSTITIVAGALQRRGMIEYSRGEVRILSRRSLEAASCECYGMCQGALRRYLAPTIALADAKTPVASLGSVRKPQHP